MSDLLTKRARELRSNSTDAEKILWHSIRSKQIDGCKFRRQQPIGDYIVDFVCFEKKLVIELDGGQHAIEREKDRLRDSRLAKEGFVVLRFWNNDVMQNLEGVLETIRKQLISPLTLTLSR